MLRHEEFLFPLTPSFGHRKIFFTMHPWECEYQQPQLIRENLTPLACVRVLLRQLKKLHFDFTHAHILDLGTGTGRHALAFAEKGAVATGYDISPSAVEIAQKNTNNILGSVTFEVRSIGKSYPLKDASMDLVLDITSSHALLQEERTVYIAEVMRVLKPGGYLFIRTFAMEGDINAKKLIKDYPGPEPNTYVLPVLQLIERVFTKKELVESFPALSLISLKKVVGYAVVSNQRYKRHYWIALFQKPLA